jgi:hypothetical protein
VVKAEEERRAAAEEASAYVRRLLREKDPHYDQLLDYIRMLSWMDLMLLPAALAQDRKEGKNEGKADSGPCRYTWASKASAPHAALPA